MTQEEIVKDLRDNSSYGCYINHGNCIEMHKAAASLIETLTLQLAEKDAQIAAVTAENKRLKEDRRWIPLTERMPTAQDADSRLCIEAYSKYLEQYIICRWYFVLDDKETTHWRKITQLPEESEGSK